MPREVRGALRGHCLGASSSGKLRSVSGRSLSHGGFGYDGGGSVHGGFDRDGWCGGQKLEHDDSTADESINVHWLFGLVEQTRK